MFQTEIIYALQGISNSYVIESMQLLTALGYATFLMGLVTVILYGIDFKKGFVLLMLVIWTGAVTILMKDLCQLPRPFQIDKEVQLLDPAMEGPTIQSDFQQPIAFFDLMPAELIEEVRNLESPHYGFPSGHTSIAVVLWGMVAFLFRRRWLTILSLSLILLVPFSRMYLGVHFLADVLGGYLLGFLAMFFAYQVLLKPALWSNYLEKTIFRPVANWQTAFLLIGPLILFFTMPTLGDRFGGLLWGYSIGFFLLASKGMPQSEAPVSIRMARTMLAIIIYVLIVIILKKGLEGLGMEDNLYLSFLRNTIEGIVFIWLAAWVNIKIGWLKVTASFSNT